MSPLQNTRPSSAEDQHAAFNFLAKSSIGFLVINAEGLVISNNDALCQLLDLPFIPKNQAFTQYIYTPEQNDFLNHCHAAIDNQIPLSFELRCYTGTNRTIWLKADALANTAITPPEIHIALTDIDHLKNLTDALAQKTEELDELLNAAIDLLCLVTEDGYFYRLSPSWASVLGYSLEYLSTLRFYDLVHPDDLISTLEMHIRNVQHKTSLAKHTNRYRHQDGSYRWLEWRIYPKGNLFYGAARDVTQYKQLVEHQLSEQDRQLKIVSLLPGIIFQLLHDTHGQYSFPFINGTIAGNFCIDPLALQSDANSLFALVHPEDLPDLLDNLRDSAATLQPCNIECRICQADGNILWVSIHSIPQRSSHGGTLWHGFLCNISQRVQLERDLEQQRQFLRQVIDTIPAMICVQNQQGEFNLINKMIEDAFGEPKRFTASQTSCAFCSSVNSLKPEITIAFMGANENEHQVTYADGSTHWLKTIKIPLVEHNGTAPSILQIGIDVTEQKLLTEQVLQTKQRLELALDGGELGMWDWHIPSGSTIISNHWCNMLGYTPNEIKPHLSSWKKMVHPADWNKINDAFNRHISNETSNYLVQYRLAHKSGHWLWVLARGKIVEWDAKGQPLRMVGTHLDITHQKATEKQLRELTQHQNAVMEAEKTRISQEIHDEFGSILTSLKIDLSWLNKKLPKDLSDFQRKIYKMSLRLEQAIQAVRHIATQLRPSILDHLGLLAAIDWQYTEFKKLTDIVGDIHLPETDLSIDPQKSTAIFRILQTALTNIALHAKATYTSLTIVIEEDNLVITLTDNGCGMTPSQMQQTGKFGILGMRERAKAFNGSITLESQLHKGTTIQLTMPLHLTELDIHND